MFIIRRHWDDDSLSYWSGKRWVSWDGIWSDGINVRGGFTVKQYRTEGIARGALKRMLETISGDQYEDEATIEIVSAGEIALKRAELDALFLKLGE